MTGTLKRVPAFLFLLLLFSAVAALQCGGAASHSFRLEKTEPATCTDDGANLYICEDCGETKTERLPALGHDFSLEWTIDRLATCTKDGQKSRHCSRCDAVTDLLRLPAKGHQSSASVIEPTCTAQGYTHHVCAVCGAGWDDNYVPASGHKPGLWVVDQEASCEDSGVRHQNCLVCDALMEQKPIPALGHADEESIIAPTCTERGYTLRTCRRCGRQTQSKYAAARGHTFSTAGQQTLAPTCTEKGSEKVTCSVCGVKENRSIPALGHDYGENWVVDKQPTCTAKGEQSLHCRRCDARKSVTPLDRTPHTEVIDISVAPTCTKAGASSGSHCAVCGAILNKPQTLPPNGHSFQVKSVLTKATCTTKGSEEAVCTVCGESEIRSVPALGHALSDVVIDKAPTCAAKGEQSQHCARCGKRFNVTELARTDHVSVKDRAVAATCTEPGRTAGAHCQNCGKVLLASESIPATGHTLKTKLVPATVGKKGVCKTICTVCRTVTEKKVIPAVKSITLSKTAFVFDGKVKTPKVKVTDAKGKVLKADRDYTVVYSKGRKAIGLYTVKVTLTGSYQGAVQKVFKIIPKAPTGLHAASKQSVILLSWNEVPGADGYRVLEYHPDAGKYTVIGSAKKLSLKIKNLLPGEKHVYIVRAFTKKGGRIFWGAVSAQKVTATRPVTPVLRVGQSKTNTVLSWNDCGDCVYAVYVSNKANGHYVCLGTTDGRIFLTAAYASGKTVYFKVRALVRNGTTDLCGTSSAVVGHTF